jgi:hypothetical protein
MKWVLVLFVFACSDRSVEVNAGSARVHVKTEHRATDGHTEIVVSVTTTEMVFVMTPVVIPFEKVTAEKAP